MIRRHLAAAIVAIALLVAGLPAVAAMPLAHDFGLVPAADAATGAPPSCNGVYKDVLTPLRGYSDWGRTLVDTIYMVPSSYYPPDLVASGVAGGGTVRSFVRADLMAMAAAAAGAGAPIQVKSAFRSYTTQISTFNYWVRVSGRSAALLSSARPGHSEHQLGTAIDFTSRYGLAPWSYADWATTKAGAWMARNAWQFGFVMTYPKGKSPTVTCYQYEPWHYRFVGREAAARIHGAGLTSREYLWTQLAGTVSATFDYPASGLTTVTRFTSNDITWTESGPFSSRSLREDTAPAVNGTCDAVAWSTAWTTGSPPNPYSITGFARGSCYRYVLTLTNSAGARTQVTSGALYVDSATTAPPQPPAPTTRPGGPAGIRSGPGERAGELVPTH